MQLLQKIDHFCWK